MAKRDLTEKQKLFLAVLFEVTAKEAVFILPAKRGD